MLLKITYTYLLNKFLQCYWCPAANRCSNGTDRHYQDWSQKGCDKASGNITDFPQCSQRVDPSSTYNVNVNHDHDHDDDHDHHSSDFTGGSYIKKIKAPGLWSEYYMLKVIKYLKTL